MERFFYVILNVTILTFMLASFALADQLALPAADVTAPVIKHKNFVNKIEAGQDYQILVTATDNIAIKSVVLYYRDIGSSNYQSRTMQNIVDTDDYAATLGSNEINSDGVEFYVQATDYAGNTLLLGYAFSPIIVKVDRLAPDAMTAMATEPETTVKKEKSNKWLWIGLGALAVGAILANSGGDSGGDNSSGKDSTVIINAPVP